MRGIELENPVHVLGQIHDYRNITALTGEAGTAAACQNRGAIMPRRGDSGDDIVRISWDDDSDRYLPIIRAVRRIERAAAIIKSHFAAHMPAQLGRQAMRVDI